MGPTTTTTEVPSAGTVGWGAFDALVRGLGSTLDPRTIAERCLELMAVHLGINGLAVFLVDAPARRLELIGRGPEEWIDEGEDGLAVAGPDEAARRWKMDDALLASLRGDEVLVEIGPEVFPPTGPGRRLHGLRLTDGRDTVGLLVIEDLAPEDRAAAETERRLATIGGLIGVAIARSLVHQTLVSVTSRLDQAQRLQQHILDHVSHEFNTPLMILKSAATFANTDDAEERNAFFDMHAQALERLEELVQGVLEVARTRSVGTAHRLGADELRRAVLEPALEPPRWPAERIHRWFDLPSALSLRIDVDGLSLVLEHLLRNAWQFGGETGADVVLAAYVDRRRRWNAASSVRGVDVALDALQASDRSVLLPGRSDGDVLVIEVVDTGIGVPADEMEAVFEPFTQARNSPLRGVSGAGMGLPTCRKRVESMGGELVLTSIEGRGTRVSVLLPLEPSSHDQRPTPTSDRDPSTLG